jgi:hypothetical protein
MVLGVSFSRVGCDIARPGPTVNRLVAQVGQVKISSGQKEKDAELQMRTQGYKGRPVAEFKTNNKGCTSQGQSCWPNNRWS